MGLKAFFAIHMYMMTKRQPTMKSYWEKEGFFLYCSTIFDIMTRRQFKELVRCLHFTNPAMYEHIPNGDPRYDKIWQVQWLVNEIRSTCMRE